MDMYSRNQYLRELRIEYHQTKSKKGKGKLLDEAEKRTGLKRKYIIRKLKPLSNLNKSKQDRKRRKAIYDSYVEIGLIKCWEIFDYPCGQRLKPLLENEVNRLRKLKELKCSDIAAEKLKIMSSCTIDRKLKHQKELERVRRKYSKKRNPLLYQKIPVKLSDEWDRNKLGNIQIDLVEHCGQSTRGEYICTLSNIDIATQWWEGEAIMGRGQIPTQQGLDRARKRFPFSWKEIHSDNGTEFINAHLFKYTETEKLEFSRSRPYKKNDNCFVEQKNWTHIKKYVGYERYDTIEELRILDDLYRNEMHIYKNFFQTTIKLSSKERIKGRIKKVYEKVPKTPYQRVMESNEVSQKRKQELKEIYNSLNPAELKRTIDVKLTNLYKAYQSKKNIIAQQEKLEKINKINKINKKLKPVSVSFLNVRPEPVSVS